MAKRHTLLCAALNRAPPLKIYLRKSYDRFIRGTHKLPIWKRNLGHIPLRDLFLALRNPAGIRGSKIPVNIKFQSRQFDAAVRAINSRDRPFRMRMPITERRAALGACDLTQPDTAKLSNNTRRHRPHRRRLQKLTPGV